MQRRHRLPRVRAFAVRLIVALLLAGATLRPAAAQFGDMNGLPDPISTEDVVRWAETLGLSDAQRLAALRALDDHAARWSDAIAEPPPGGMPRGLAEHGFRIRPIAFDPEQQRARLAAHRAISGRLEAIDDAWFDALEEVLNEDQQARLTRVRRERERTRLATPMVDVAPYGWRVHDLAAIFRDRRRPDGPAGAAIDAILEDYEAAVVARLRTVRRDTAALAVELADEVAAFRAASAEDPPATAAEGEAYRAELNAAIAEAWERHAGGMQRLTQLNDATWTALAEALPLRDRSMWRRSWLDARRLGSPGSAAIGPTYLAVRALETPGLEEEQRTLLEALADEAEAREGAIRVRVLEAREAADAVVRRHAFGNRPDSTPGLDAARREVTRDLRALAADTEHRVASIAGEDWKERRDALQAARRAARAEARRAAGAAAGAPPPEAGGRVAPPSPRRWFPMPASPSTGPAPIDHEVVERVLAHAGVAREVAADVRERHAAYLEAFRADDVIAAASAIDLSVYDERSEQARLDDGARARSTFEEAARAAMRHGLEFLAELADADRDLAASPLLGLLDGIIRRRARAGAGSDRLVQGMARRRTQRTDLVAFMLVTIDDDRIGPMLPILLETGTALDGPTRTRFVAAADVIDAEVAMPWTSTGDRTRRADLAWSQNATRPAHDRLAAARRDLRVARASALDAVAEAAADALGPEDGDDLAGRLVRAWRDACWPHVVRDPVAIHTQLEAALALDDLRDAQRERIIEMLQAYRAEWNAATDGMVDLLERYEDGRERASSDRPPSQRDLVRELTARFDERSDRALRIAEELRVLLDERQLAELPPLPEGRPANGQRLAW